jgi:hypothetical protein
MDFFYLIIKLKINQYINLTTLTTCLKPFNDGKFKKKKKKGINFSLYIYTSFFLAALLSLVLVICELGHCSGEEPVIKMKLGAWRGSRL